MIVLCQCAYAAVLNRAAAGAVEAALAAAGVPHAVVPDLCECAARRDARLREWAEAGATFVACHPRAVRWLLHQAGASPDAGRFLNLRTDPPDAILAALGLPAAAAPAPEPPPPRPAPAWPPWFPVIDYARCTRCRQCLDFCLFGVYAPGADGGVAVAQPDRCKNNCPACARICPEVAIIFPKLAEAPINGADITDETAARATVRVNVNDVLGADPHAALAARRLRRRKAAPPSSPDESQP